MAVTGTPPSKPTNWETFSSKLAGRVGDNLIEVAGTAVAVVGIALIDFLVKWLLGEDAKFFGAVPVQWAFDLAHICLIGRLIWRIFVPEKTE